LPPLQHFEILAQTGTERSAPLAAVCAVVDLGSVFDVEDVHGARVFFNAVDDPVGSAAGSSTI
jgi:hypothetical protein